MYNILNWDDQIREMIGMAEAAMEKGGVEPPHSRVSSFGPAIMFSEKGKGSFWESGAPGKNLPHFALEPVTIKGETIYEEQVV